MSDAPCLSPLRQLLTRATYPLLMISVLALYAGLLAVGWSMQWAAYGAVTVGAVVIGVLERWHPERAEWRAGASEIMTDAGYMVVVQVLLPRLLALAVALTLLAWLAPGGPVVADWWPGHWPVPVQAVLMLVSADLLRYWMHRLAHHWLPLWRLHAVHHAPRRLYWVNVARFHPLEKAIQFLADTLPFLILGVSAPVVTLYFVFYAVNGFFQHCNIHLRLGWLNYLVSGPELHRWHHSEDPQESGRNFGNNLILWDLLFGTYYLPKGETVDALGLPNRDYPTGFLGQLLAPFRRGLEQE